MELKCPTILWQRRTSGGVSAKGRHKEPPRSREGEPSPSIAFRFSTLAELSERNFRDSYAIGGTNRRHRAGHLPFPSRPSRTSEHRGSASDRCFSWRPRLLRPSLDLTAVALRLRFQGTMGVLKEESADRSEKPTGHGREREDARGGCAEGQEGKRLSGNKMSRAFQEKEERRRIPGPEAGENRGRKEINDGSGATGRCKGKSGAGKRGLVARSRWTRRAQSGPHAESTGQVTKDPRRAVT